MTTHEAAAIHRLLRSAAHPDDAHATDKELLRRFAAARDQAAFAVLVRRHAGMVLGVCRRALPTVQDAEDACQATFLVLAQKAATGAWQASVANWLYTTARRVARNAGVDARRRALREARANVPAPVSTLDHMTGRELLAALDEELARLPARYREPLVLCYLEGLTRDQAAARLGLSPATLKSQLERGRKQLGAALTKRGCTLGLGILAVTATSPAGASPPRLLDTILAAAAGQPSAAVAALAQGVTVIGTRTKLLGILALVLGTAIWGLGSAGPAPTAAGQAPEEKAMPAREAGKAEKGKAAPGQVFTRTVTGRVLDPDGKPIAGADLVFLRIQGPYERLTTTGPDGTFRVTVELKGPGAWLAAVAEGYGIDAMMPAGNTPADVSLRLVKDTPIRGRVIDTQGKPVAGAVLQVRRIASYPNQTLDGYLTAWIKRTSYGPELRPAWQIHLRHGIGSPRPEPWLAAVTDADGRFTIAHVGAERVVNLNLGGPGLAEAEAVILTRPGFDPAPYNRRTQEMLRESDFGQYGYQPLMHGPAPTIVAEAEKPIRGVVQETDTGKPRAGVTVTLRQGRQGRLPDRTTTTDAAGRFAFHGVTKAAAYELAVSRDTTAGTVGRTIQVPDTPGYAPVEATIGVAKGVIVTGRVLDAATGKPIAGLANVGILADNAFINARPEFATPDCYDSAPTDANGVFRTVALPGRVLLMGGPIPTGAEENVYLVYQQQKPDPDYPQYFRFENGELFGFHSPGGATTVLQGQYCKVLTLDPAQAEVTADVLLRRASTFTLKVRDTAGQPVRGALAAGVTARAGWVVERCPGDVCTVYGLEEARPRLVVLYDPQRNLAASLTVTGQDLEPAAVELRPAGAVKGKLVNAAGQPLAHIRVQVSYPERPADEIGRRVSKDREAAGQYAETDAAGAFTVDGVLPGHKFVVVGRRGDRFLEPPSRKPEDGYTGKSGETVDVGTITLK